MPSKLELFRNLHESGCFVLPNPWDIGSAICLQQLGFPAVATTSAGLSFSVGRPDRVRSLNLELVLDHVRALVEATRIPVAVDFQNGYAEAPEGVALNVARCLRTGAAGLSIEDATGDESQPLTDRDHAIERVEAACAARDSTAPSSVITARCEAFLFGVPDPARVVLDRLVAYAEAGADCLFAPGVSDPRVIADIVAAVAPKPVNVLVSAPGFTFGQLVNLGVRRISVGSALARVAWGAFLQAARDIVGTGSFESLAGAASFAELDGFFEGEG